MIKISTVSKTEKATAPYSSTLAWKIPWTEEPGRLQSLGLLRVRHDWATSLSLFTSCIGEGNGNPLQCSCLENPKDGGAWWAAISGVEQSWTWLKWLSSSSSSSNCIKEPDHPSLNSYNNLHVSTHHYKFQVFIPSSTLFSDLSCFLLSSDLCSSFEFYSGFPFSPSSS